MFEKRFGQSGKLKPSFANSHYTQVASAIIDHSCSMVDIICNDLSCIAYPEIEYSIGAARKAGPAVLIYAKKADSSIVDRLRQLDVQLCVKDHNLDDNDYIISDRQIVLTSRKDDGGRTGYWEINRERAHVLSNKFAMIYRDVNPTLVINGSKGLCSSSRDHEEVPREVIAVRTRAYEEMLRRISADGRADIGPEFDRALRDLES
jgi:hypothetical protein